MPKQFLQLGGTIFVLIGIMGFTGVLGPTANDSLFGSWWWFDGTENWTYLMLGIIALGASFILSPTGQRILAGALGAMAILVAAWGFIDQTIFGATLQIPDMVLLLALGVWALFAAIRREIP